MPMYGGIYWILDIDPEYQWVLVGEPCAKAGWLLAKGVTLPDDVQQKALVILKDVGYDTSKENVIFVDNSNC